jgi:hypothetical protein
MATRFVLLALVVSYIAALQSSKAESESLFALLTIGAVLCLFRCAAQVEASVSKHVELRWRDWLLAGLLIGLAYWVRYAGLFLFATAAVLAAAALYLLSRRHAAKPPRWYAAQPIAAIAVAASMISLLFWRNIVYTGSWKGGNTKDVVNPLLGFLKIAIATAYQIFLGTLELDRLGVLEVVFALGALAVGVVVLLKLVPRLRDLRLNSGVRIALTVSVTFVSVYTAAFLYLGVFSVISFSDKMFYPILPLLLLLIGWMLDGLQHVAPPEIPLPQDPLVHPRLFRHRLEQSVARIRDAMRAAGIYEKFRGDAQLLERHVQFLALWARDARVAVDDVNHRWRFGVLDVADR